MKLTLGDKIKELRKRDGRKQEDLANALGVTNQAVSRWEANGGYPDIEMLPVIAEYFSVSLEELLGVEQSKRKAKAQEYKTLFKEYIEHGKIEECIDTSRKAVKEFPRDWELQNQLMYALFVSGSDDGDIENWQENQAKYKQEIIDIGNNIIEHCTDDAIRLEAKSRLGFHYCELGELEKGKAVFDSLPTVDSCKESMMYWALRGEERKQHNRDMFSLFLSRALWNLWTVAIDNNGSYDATVKELLKYEKIIELVYDDDDYGDWNLGLAQLYFYKLAPISVENQKIDEMYNYLEKGLYYLKEFAKLPEAYFHTSYLVKGVCDNRYGDTADSRAPWDIIREKYLSDKMYDSVRNDARFVSILNELKSIEFSN